MKAQAPEEDESLIDDSPLNNEESSPPNESLIDDSPLNDNDKNTQESGKTILPPPD